MYPVPYGNSQQGSRQRGAAAGQVQGKQPKPRRSVLGSAFGYGMIGVDTYMRVKDGESLIPAVGKAVATNAFWAMMPGGWGAALGIMALQAAPAVANAIDSIASGLSAKSQAFGGGYTQNEAQEWMKTEGITNMTNARQSAAAVMANHARGARRIY